MSVIVLSHPEHWDFHHEYLPGKEDKAGVIQCCKSFSEGYQSLHCHTLNTEISIMNIYLGKRIRPGLYSAAKASQRDVSRRIVTP